MEEMISKKDLLKVTGISYGQLYRWKREMLIPEEWFVKQSSITGQETYFPRDKMLQRVKRILTLKDKYSLEELAGMLSPEIVDRNFNEEELEQFQEIDIQVAALFMDVLEKDIFRFREIIAMMAYTQIKKELQIDEEEMLTLIKHSAKHIIELKNLDMTLHVVMVDKRLYSLFFAEKEHLIFDDRMEVKKKIYLQELSNMMKEKYRDVFLFSNDEDTYD